MTAPWATKRVLLATSEPVYPISYGGIQASAHDLLTGLSELLGADARLLTATPTPDHNRCKEQLDALGIPYTDTNRELEYHLGSYPATLVDEFRFSHRLRTTVAAWSPDVIVAQAAGWRDVLVQCRGAARLVHWMHGYLGLLGQTELPAADLLLANSEYTAQQVFQRFALKSDVFHPAVEPGRVRTSRSAGAMGAVTLINPHPTKGIDLFLKLVRHFPDRHFMVVDCWGTAPYIERALSRLPNVRHVTTTSRISEVYAETAVLVVPTFIDETFGRVVIEANMNGIPVLASDRGALPSTVGGGGLVLSVNAEFEAWANALQILTNADQYPNWSNGARTNAARFDFHEAIHRFAQLVDAI